jgi:hypothetical protein
MVVIYADTISARLKYICSLLFNDLLAIPVSFTNSVSEFENCNLPKLNYSKNKLLSGIFMECVDLLFETEVTQQTIEVKRTDTLIFFFSSTSASDFEFDLFAASFYLVSRYEEYLHPDTDIHGRFDVKASLAYKHNFLQQPLVNKWAQLLRKKLLHIYPLLTLPVTKFNYLSTIDIDNGYNYKGKNVIRTLGGLLKALVDGNFRSIGERLLTLIHIRPDPFDRYDLQKQLKEKYDIDMIYFFLFAPKSKYDTGLSPKSKHYHQLIKKISSYTTVGLHPSYASHEHVARLQKEVVDFSSVIGFNIEKSRQHFLKFKLPETYNNLIAAGIREDYSMGYASEPGFRASICTPYYFYDLKRNTSTELKLIPLSMMEGTFMEYKKMQPAQALIAIKQLMQEAEQVNGLFVSIWHERFFEDNDHCQPWIQVYEEMLKEARRLMDKQK